MTDKSLPEKALNFTPIVRIVLYFISGALLAGGLVNEDMGKFIREDAELLGTTTLVVSALWYRHAKKTGRPT